MPQIDLTGVSALKLLSHSSLETLHSCPRKFEIYRMNYAPKSASTIDTAFGHAVGVGIQELLRVQSLTPTAYLIETEMLTPYQIALWQMFLSWDVPIDEEKPKANKSFALACIAVEKYQQQLLPALSEEWELASFEGKPAVELGFIIELPNGYYYRGYVDAVLVHKTERRFRVLELKTTGLAVVDIAQYKNSFQGVGYGVILDKLASTMEFDADYYVDYLVYKTKAMEYVPMPFMKTLYQRAKWLSQLLIETKTIELYLENNLFPTHGQSCFNYFRPCQYFGMCERNNKELQVNKTNLLSDSDFASNFLAPTGLEVTNKTLDTGTKVADNSNIEEFDFVINFQDLVSRQYETLNQLSVQVAGNLEIEM